MEVEQLGFSADPDPELWIPVPLDFPLGEWPNPESWAREIALGVLDGVDGVTEPVKRQFMQLAHAIATAEAPLPEEQARFWYFPVFGGAMQLAHLYAAPREQLAGMSLVEAAAGGPGQPAPQRAEEWHASGFTEAWFVVLLDEIPGGQAEQLPVEAPTAIGSIRFIGEQGGMVLMLEASGADLMALAAMKDDLGALFGTVGMGSAPH